MNDLISNFVILKFSIYLKFNFAYLKLFYG